MAVRHAVRFETGVTAVKRRDNEGEAEEASSLEDARMLLSRWRRRAIVLGSALFASVASVVPFLEGHSLHAQFDKIGKFLIVLSMCLLPLAALSAAFTYNFWTYLRDLKKANRKGSANT
jgi:hypothetical protein